VPEYAELVERALEEDLGAGDVTTAATVAPGARAVARIVQKAPGVISGLAVAEAVLARLDPGVQIERQVAEGEWREQGGPVLEARGDAAALLSGERTALNFLQLLSGTATTTRAYVEAVAGTGCRILDTRKTVPGLRTAQKYAVRCGGADNHRMGLFDQILIKENHIAAAGSITAAIVAARQRVPAVPVVVEVESLGELGQALAAHPDIVLLDEFTLDDMRAAVALNRAHSTPVKLEASGSVSPENVRAIAATGVDYVSVGSLTKHLRAVDLSMRLEFGRD
jgi:nicotinate-nucleotide pyrophosphorylase (carboxylating)